MVLGRFARGDSAAISIDRVVAAVAVAALILAAIVGIRAGVDRFSGTNLSTLGGLRLLAPDDILLTFEDFEHGAPGWANGVHDQSTDGFGGILGRFGGTDGAEAVSRRYGVTAERRYAVVSFDLHAIDAWALEDLIVFANGVEVLRQNFSTDPDAAARQRPLLADLPWMHAALSASPRSGRDLGFAGGGEAAFDQTVHVELTLFGPPADLRIGFGATLPAAETDTASWAVDNMQIVLTNRLPDRG